jgi:hypothetical protein
MVDLYRNIWRCAIQKETLRFICHISRRNYTAGKDQKIRRGRPKVLAHGTQQEKTLTANNIMIGEQKVVDGGTDR